MAGMSDRFGRCEIDHIHLAIQRRRFTGDDKAFVDLRQRSRNTETECSKGQCTYSN
jgi:hypothetical protein